MELEVEAKAGAIQLVAGRLAAAQLAVSAGAKKILLFKKAESEVADQVIANFGFVFKLGGTEMRGKLSISSDANVGAAVSAISEILMRLDIGIGSDIVDGAPMAQSASLLLS